MSHQVNIELPLETIVYIQRYGLEFEVVPGFWVSLTYSGEKNVFDIKKIEHEESSS